jgi:large subunit ribosomal protein L9
MEVILKQDVEKLGKAGSVVKVKDGFGRNYLIAKGLAIPVTASNLKQLEQEKQRKEAQQVIRKKEAEAVKEKLAGMSLTIASLTQDDEKLYGSITNQDIAQALKDEGLEIDKNIIMLDEPIKALGIYEVPVELHLEVQTKVKVWIVKK